MKKLLLLLNLILVPVSYFGYCYYKDTPPREDYSSYAIKTDSGKNTILQVVSVEQAISSKEVDEVIDAVPFDPKRCGEPKKQENKKQTTPQAKPGNLNLKLVGVCLMGKKSGAIIIDNSRTRSVRPRPRTNRSRYRSRHVRRPSRTPVRLPQKQEAGKSCYYRIGDKLPCGYNVKEIKEESVMLAQGGTTFELKLEDAETTAKTAAVLPEKRIISAKGSASHATAPTKLNHNRNIHNRGHGK